MSVLDGAALSRKDGVEGNVPSSWCTANIFALFLRGAPLLSLRSSVRGFHVEVVLDL